MHAGIYAILGNTLPNSKRFEQFGKGIQLFTPDNGSAVGGITAGGELFLFGLPEGLDGGLDERVVVTPFHNFIVGYLQRYIKTGVFRPVE